MAMVRASLVRFLLAWLDELQQLYRMVALAGVIIPAGETYARVSFKLERVFNVIAHVGTGSMPRRFAVAVQIDSWRLSAPSGVHGPRVTCGQRGRKSGLT